MHRFFKGIVYHPKPHYQAFTYLWIVVSILTLLVPALFLLPSGKNLLSMIPECEWQVKHGKSCILCGMTTAFTLISSGDFHGAYEAHKLSLLLYGFMVLNQVFLTLYLVKKTLFRIKKLRIQ